MRLLLDAGARVNPEDHSENPLYYAVLSGNQEMVALLLDHGAEIDRPHRYRGLQTPFAAAVNAGKLDMADLLLSRGAKRRIDVVGAIDLDNKALEKLQFLVDRNVVFDGADAFNHHPLLKDAVGRGREDVVEVLLTNRAKTNVQPLQITAALGVLELRIGDMQRVPSDEERQQQLAPFVRIRDMLKAAVR
jgi:ankyrin repeat protein